METKKLIGAAAFSLALAGGGVAGALIGSPGSSGAQETTTTADSADSPADAPPPHGPGHHVGHRKELALDAAAEAIGITEDELRSELEAGKTIAGVATEHGVDVNAVIDAMVTEATANIREHVTALVNGELPDKPGHGPFPFVRAELDDVAEMLGLTTDELHQKLHDGSSIADVAAEQNVDVQTIIDKLVADATAKIDEKVASGDLTQERADELKADLEEHITRFVNNDGPFFRHGDGPRP